MPQIEIPVSENIGIDFHFRYQKRYLAVGTQKDFVEDFSE